MRRLLLVAACLASTVPVGATPHGVAVGGADYAVAELPVNALAEDYDAAGYWVRVRRGRATVSVDLAPLGSATPWRPPERWLPGEVGRLAAAVAAGSTTRYEASSRILAWVGTNIRYSLEREQPQDAVSVLARRSAYCTGLARLTVALLAAAGIPAREVAGWVAGDGGPGPSGYHRWVEIQFADRGWVPSDPGRTHHYVPATYVRLASETLLAPVGGEQGRLLARRDARRPVDLHAGSPAGVSARRNAPLRISAALRVDVGDGRRATAHLEGGGLRRSRELVAGSGTFLGLEPGEYILVVEAEDWPPIRKSIRLADRDLATVTFEPRVRAWTASP